MHAEQVILADVVDRRAAGDEEREDAEAEEDDLAPRDRAGVGKPPTPDLERVPVAGEQSGADDDGFGVHVPVEKLLAVCVK